MGGEGHCRASRIVCILERRGTEGTGVEIGHEGWA